MPFFVYGSDAKTGEVIKRYLSQASTEAEAREEAQARGVAVSAVVACDATAPAPTTATPRPRADGGRTALAAANVEASKAEMAAFQQTLMQYTPTAYVTYGLIGINVLVFIAMLLSGVNAAQPTVSDLLRWGAEFGPYTSHGQWWRILTSVFVHIGIIHLFFNMLAFAYVGPTVERMIGNLSFLLVYVVAGLGGSLWAMYWDPMLIHAGASGAIFGIYGALGALLLRQHDAIPAPVLAKLRKFVTVFVVYNIANSLRPGISLAAHVGGLVTGFLLGLYIAGQPLTEDELNGRPMRQIWAGVSGAILVGVGVFGVLAKYPNLNHLQEILEHFDAAEKQTHQSFSTAAGKAQQHELSDAQFADLIETSLLPDWRTLGDQLNSVSSIPSATVTKVRNYVHLRQDGLEALAGALRSGNDESMHEATAKQDQADKLSSWASAAKAK